MSSWQLAKSVLPGVGLSGLYAWAGGGIGEQATNMATLNGTIPATAPAQLNTNVGLTGQARSNYTNIINQKPMFKRASGGNMKLDQIVSKFREKRAAGGDPTAIGSVIKHTIRPALQTILYGLGAGMLGSTLYDKYQHSQQSQEAYKDMFERFPELQSVDPNRIDDYWGLMQQYAPSMTRNPLVAGQFIKNMADYNLKGVDFPTLKSILDVETAATKKENDALTMVVKGVGSGVE